MKRKNLSLLFVLSVFISSFVLLPQAGLAGTSSTSLLARETFENYMYEPWDLYVHPLAEAEAKVLGNKLYVTVRKAGINRHDIQLRHRGLKLRSGQTYNYDFRVSCSKPLGMRFQVGMIDIPYSAFRAKDISFTSSATQTRQTGSFTMNENYFQGEMAFHLSSTKTPTPYVVVFDWIKLNNPISRPPQPPITAQKIRVNANGYAPNAKKIAIMVSSSPNPLPWYLIQTRVGTVSSGITTYLGHDSYSGDYLHRIDFTSYNRPNPGVALYVMENGITHASSTFPITYDAYRHLMVDSLHFFYHQRSGIDILSRYTMASSGQNNTLWARPAGHVNDKAVPLEDMPAIPGDSMPCGLDAAKAFLVDPRDYSTPVQREITVNKGWYDAGDHGKYVVNGALALWIMHNQYERMMIKNSPIRNRFEDGGMLIPENNNSRPDILDEARWQMEMLLAMQVPNGDPKAGMVYHKLHDHKWTELPKTPKEATDQSNSYYDPNDVQNKTKIYRRVFYPPSTAATLNLAAVAAQSYRVWRYIDNNFAEQCLAAAKKAFKAAVDYKARTGRDILTQEIYLPDPRDGSMVKRPDYGGGFYEDRFVNSNGTVTVDLEDEYYWAACELFLATRESTYFGYAQRSKHFCKITGDPLSGGGPFDWRDTASLGTISLALVPTNYQRAAQYSIMEYADKVVEILNRQKYPVPLTRFWWGSNSQILNRTMILAYANDFYQRSAYLDAITQSLDYLMGINGMGHSFITGYGYGGDSLNPHHRYWAYQANHTLPKPPPGIVVGGPNEMVKDWDNLLKGYGLETKTSSGDKVATYPLKAYCNNILSYASNEVTINWNAPLAWIAAYCHEKLGR